MADASDARSGVVRSAQGNANHGNPAVLMLTAYRSQTGASGAAVDSPEDAEDVPDTIDTDSIG